MDLVNCLFHFCSSAPASEQSTSEMDLSKGAWVGCLRACCLLERFWIHNLVVWRHSDLEPKRYKQFTGLFSRSVKSSLGTQLGGKKGYYVYSCWTTSHLSSVLSYQTLELIAAWEWDYSLVASVASFPGLRSLWYLISSIQYVNTKEEGFRYTEDT